MTGQVIPFNPLDKASLGSSVADALLKSHAKLLSDLLPFKGAGIYAIYYGGPFPAYKPLAKREDQDAEPPAPIYVGKAVPQGARKGGGLTDGLASRALFARLSEHVESIRAATNLKLEHFAVRYLVVDDIWIPLGESLLIAKFSPLWNSLVDGFGNHDPGKGRYQGLRPRWDVLHPGRAWALKCKEREESKAGIEQDTKTFFRNQLT